jgi:hypothetical protein
MPKALLEFNLPEEEQEHRDALDGTNWKLVAWDVDQILRNAIKHGCDQCEDNKYSAFEYIRKELHASIESYKLSLLD